MRGDEVDAVCDEVVSSTIDLKTCLSEFRLPVAMHKAAVVTNSQEFIDSLGFARIPRIHQDSLGFLRFATNFNQKTFKN